MPIFQTSTGGQCYFRFPEGETVDVNENASLQDNLSMIRGRHTFKTGYELLRTSINSHLEQRPSGTYLLGGTEFPFTPNTGNPFASFLLGTVTRADFTRALATWLPQWWSHALYFQDDWKVTNNLTLNLGVRWQTESPYRSQVRAAKPVRSDRDRSAHGSAGSVCCIPLARSPAATPTTSSRG